MRMIESTIEFELDIYSILACITLTTKAVRHWANEYEVEILFHL